MLQSSEHTTITTRTTMGNPSLLSPVARRLSEKVALITGGASGIGKSTAKLFTQHGAKVIIADIQDDLGHSLCKEIGSSSTSYVHCDVTDENQVENAINTAISNYGKLDIVFNNAGYIDRHKARIQDNEKADFEWMKTWDSNPIGWNDEMGKWESWCSTVCWFIWKERCRVLFDKVKGDPRLVGESIVRFMGSLGVLTDQNKPNTQLPINITKWSPPDLETIKVNFDASFMSSNFKTGIGFVIRDATGICHGVGATSCFATTSEIGECLALLHAARWARQINMTNICFEGDSKEIIDHLKGGKSNLHWRSKSILVEVENMKKEHANWTFKFVFRDGNKVADRLAKEARAEGLVDYWVITLPLFLDPFLCNDYPNNGVPVSHNVGHSIVTDLVPISAFAAE